MTRFSKFAVISFFSLFVFSLIGFAQTSKDITKEVTVICDGIDFSKIADDSISTHSGAERFSITVTGDIPIGGVYLKYNSVPEKCHLSDGTAFADKGFIHEYIALSGKTNETLYFENADICDIYIYGVGEIPKDVQVWNEPSNETDILLYATHSDDDQLFFAGLLPYYAAFRGADVTVAYFVNHFDTYNRTHELLDGLWHCGVKNYPIISPFPDGYSESAEGAVSFFEGKNISYDEVLEHNRLLLNSLRPLVVVLHDFNGEYGHGQHMLCTKSFIEVLENPLEGQFIPSKVYVHLYENDEIILPIDEPLEIFDGASAFNISQQAFMYHKSQHWTWFYEWIYGKNTKITSSSQIRSYNPAKYGLYFSSVGNDKEKNDLLENIETYAEYNTRIEEEEEKRTEQQAEEYKSETEISHKPCDKTTFDNEVTHQSIKDSEEQSFCPAWVLISFFIIIILVITFFIIQKRRRQ